MTRYSRSVMPGRSAAEETDTGLDRMVFGAKRRSPAAANDVDEPDFLPPLADDETDLLIARSNSDRRRAAPDRRDGDLDRRQSSGRRVSEYAPLREQPPAGQSDDSRRGPLLLLGALVIVAVFAVVVWNAYRDGVQGESEASAPELSTSGAFKTPPREVPAAPVVTEPTSVDVMVEDALAGPPPAAAVAEERPAPVEIKPAAEPPASKVMAPPPAPLKQPVAAAPVQTAAAAPTVAAKPSAPKPAAVQPAPKPVAAAPVAAAPAAAGVYKPSFAAYGDHVVQIAATSSQSSAEGEWTKMKGAHADLLSGAERFIQEADVNGRTVYRLRVGSFASKADAAAFCTAFKARGGNCYPAVK
jgi:hypothetical protein